MSWVTVVVLTVWGALNGLVAAVMWIGRRPDDDLTPLADTGLA